MSDEELLCQVALTMVPRIGDVLAKELLEHIPDAPGIFKASVKELECIPGIGTLRAQGIRQFKDFRRAEEEIAFIRQYNIAPLFYTDPAYPRRLKHCYDSPVLLYYKGNAALNHPRVLSVVGTRHNSAYGKEICEQLIRELAEEEVMIVSGLAYGIDIAAHKSALAHGLPTVAVLAHGLDRIYPAVHKTAARQICGRGGLLSDFRSRTTPDKQNFPSRNRIVAGLSDATVVVETDRRGGSMITAAIANSYNREVFAFPGRIQDTRSAGCHYLIRKNKAALITGAADLMDMMGWEPRSVRPAPQREPEIALNEQEQAMVSLLRDNTAVHIDELYIKSSLTRSEAAAVLLNLELRGVIRSLPGKLYQHIRS